MSLEDIYRRIRNEMFGLVEKAKPTPNVPLEKPFNPYPQIQKQVQDETDNSQELGSPEVS